MGRGAGAAAAAAAGLLLLAGLWAGARRGASSEPTLSCRDCLAVAARVAGALEGPAAGVNAASRRRRLDFSLTEARVSAALSTACGAAGADAQRTACAALLAPRRAALEGALLDGGAAGFPSLLCAELLRLCSPHEVAGGVEL